MRAEPAGCVVIEAENPQLFDHVRDIDLGGDPGMLSGLDGILLRGQAKRIKAHRVQDVAPSHAEVTRNHVSGDITQRMAELQTDAAGVRKKIQNHRLSLRGVERGVTRIRYLEDLVVFPISAPARLEISSSFFIPFQLFNSLARKMPSE